MAETASPAIEAATILDGFAVPRQLWADGLREVRSPIDGAVTARLRETTPERVRAAVTAAHEAFLRWRLAPAPRRGELVRLLAEE